MSIRQNRFNDPALGAAFGNLASIFAPPSAQDMAGYATANAKKQEAEQLAWLFDNAMDPTASARSAVTGVQSYGNTPTGFTYEVDQNNATTRRGQDVASSTALGKARIDGQYGLANQFMTPLNPGQVQPGLPEGIAGAFNVPPMPRTEGAAKPISLDEAKALTFYGMTPEMRDAITFGGTPIEQVLDPDGGAVNVTRTDAIGRTPLPPAQGSQAAPDTQNYRGPNGEAGTAVFTPDRGWVDTQTGEPLPPGSQTVKANATGSASDVLGPQRTNLTRAREIRASVASMNDLVGNLEQTIQATAGAAGLAASVLSFFQDARQVAKELTMAAGNNPNAPVTPETMKAMSEALLGRGEKYDPTFRRVHAMLLELAYSNARLNNPSGEVGVRALEREIEALGQGITGNDQSVLASVGVSRERMARALLGAEVLEGRSQGPTREEVLGGQAPPAADTPPEGMDPADWEFMTPEERALFQ